MTGKDTVIQSPQPASGSGTSLINHYPLSMPPPAMLQDAAGSRGYQHGESVAGAVAVHWHQCGAFALDASAKYASQAQ